MVGFFLVVGNFVVEGVDLLLHIFTSRVAISTAGLSPDTAIGLAASVQANVGVMPHVVPRKRHPCVGYIDISFTQFIFHNFMFLL
jgi:hypothetical protein